MDVRAAAELIEAAIPPGSGIWADFGAGTGTFTFALASLLQRASRIIAIDLDAAALDTLRHDARRRSLGDVITTQVGDFRDAPELPPLAGFLLANALHFVPEREQAGVLDRLAGTLRTGDGRVLLVDYDGRAANHWVPFPIPAARFTAIASELGWPAPTFVASRQSRYGGSIYAAYVQPRG